MVRKTSLFLTLLILLGGLAALFARPVTAGTQPQVVYQTPTARPDGRVVYIVQDGDSCLRIQLLTGATIDTLRVLNRLDQACTIAPGQELLLMVVTPVVLPTANPKVTNTPLLPTLTPSRGNGKICILLYNDLNGDAVHQDSEDALAGGAGSITDPLGGLSNSITTTAAAEPICQDVPEGNYNISMAIPGGYNPTTVMNLEKLRVQAGDTVNLEFGAQVSAKSDVPTTPTTQVPGESNLLLVVLGGLMIVFGLGLGGYILFTRR